MNRHSILFKINIIFIIGFLAVCAVTAGVWLNETRAQHREVLSKVPKLLKMISLNEVAGKKEKFIALAESHALSLVPEAERMEVFSKARVVTPPMKPAKMGRRALPIRLLRFEQSHYLHFHYGNVNLLFKDEGSEGHGAFPPLLFILLGTLALLSIMYYWIRQSILPIKELEKEIRAFGEGALVMPRENGKKDEISTVAREFYKSVKKIRVLTESRKLFLRNIMHELNTPVTKGKIIAAMIEDKNKTMLENIFERLEMLIKELANVEKVSSGNQRFDIKEYRMVDIIDHAKDLLYVKDEIESNITMQTMTCDYDMMSLVFKNLIENALKYGSNLKITVENGSVHFVSDGKALEHEFNHYIEPFIKGDAYENVSSGFGLGLYIVNEILLRQGFGFSYCHRAGKNIFTIEQTSIINS